MKRALLVTMAGTSTRFRATAGRDILKSLYHEGPVGESLLHFFGRVARGGRFGAARFVGGYQFSELTAAVETPAFRALVAGIDFACVQNPRFDSLGSGYSLYLGLRSILDDPACAGVGEVLFMEGDLAVDPDTLERVMAEEGDVLTACREPVTAARSVCVYQAMGGEMRFVYDPAHEALRIPEPFRAVHNSGQVWKFADRLTLAAVLEAMSPADLAGTNLVIVQEYFRRRPGPRVHTFDRWHNCNCLEDYRAARPLLGVGIK